MEALITRPFPPTVPEVIRLGHAQLPNEVLSAMEAQLQEIITQQQLELSLIEQYKRAEIYLTDVSVALGHYPNVEQTMKWLGTRKVPLGGNGEDMKDTYAHMQDFVTRRKARLAQTA